jgi:uncharacterized protein YxjI
MKPRLIVEQKITAFVNRYAVYTANEDGSKGDLFAFAQQKRLAFKEKVEFYANEEKSQLAFTLRAEKVMDVHGRYFVEDPNGNLLGAFRKDFKKSLLKSTWHIVDAQDQPVLSVSESSTALAAFRRFIGLIPIIGDFGGLIVLFFKYHFKITTPDEQEAGIYRKTKLIRDHYLLTMDDQHYAAQDKRVLAAQAVALDALQSR